MGKYDALKLENQLCFPLYAASRVVVRQYRPFLSALDLTYTQYVTMMVLWEEETIGAKALGDRLYLDSGTLTPVLKSLERKGLICRSRSEEDERALLVSLTEAGRALKDRALAVPGKVAGCVRMEPQEAQALYALLYRLLGAVEEEKTAP